ncbi:MAG: glycosyltransferase family 39 protein [Acidobacteriota bacterium]|nr:glycosyltransferase family 39 protein [Acidobacteriota bacterium]
MTAADPHRFPRRAVLALLALAATLGLLELGRRDLWAPDEPKYALVAREMLETGQFLRPHVNGAPYPDKPPLLFWCIALASLVTGGVGQPAAVLPSILAMLLTLWATGRLAHRLSGQRAPPVLAVGLLLVAYRFISQGTFGQIDMLLTACTTWAFLLLVEGGGLLEGRPVDRRRIVGAFALMGLGILAKGPVALICPLGGFLLGAALAGRRDTWRSLRSAAAWLTLLAVVGAWLIPAAVGALSGGQQAWLENILFRQTAVRYAASWHHHQPPWYFLVVPWYDFLPTILLLPAAAWSLLRGEDRHRTAPRLLAGACLFVLIFFSIPSGKRGLYLMPLYPWLATWLAIDLDRRLQRAGRALAPLRGAGMLLGVAFLAAAAWLPAGLEKVRQRQGVDLPAAPLFTVLLLLTLAHLWLALRPGRRALAGTFATWLLLHGLIFTVIHPAFDPRKSARPFIAAIRQRTVEEATGGMVDFRAQFAFYGGRLLTAQPRDDAAMDRIARRLESDEPFWVIVRRPQAEGLLSRIHPDRRPTLIVEKGVGDKDLVVYANRAALKDADRP